MTCGMARDKSWEAVLDPGKATDFFAAATRPEFLPTCTDWQRGNAWWCSEISRTIYRRDDRPRFLRAAGLHERRHFDEGSTQASLVTGEGFAVLVFRGTQGLRDWWTNLRIGTRTWPPGGKVHEGFLRALHKVRKPIADALVGIDTPIFVTGHSLGGALATLSASLQPFAACYTFGAPRVGDRAFYDSLQCPLHRVVNDRDLVPALPPERLGYAHGGELHHIRADGSLVQNPTEQEIEAARSSLDDRRWFEPHEALTDHAPTNYSALLE